MITIKAKKGACELCGAFKELRPYGPNNEWICFRCGMADEQTTKEQFGEFIKGGLCIDTELIRRTDTPLPGEK